MELNGKCKEAFEEWLLGKYNFMNLYTHIDDDLVSYIDFIQENTLKDEIRNIFFYRLPESMKYGVLVDFFDSVGIRIDIGSGIVSDEFHFDIKTHRIEYVSDRLKTRPEARTKAIEKANEIFNNK